jgi:deoxyribonuclease-4
MKQAHVASTRGVVFHCGSLCDLDPKLAMEMMRKNIRKLAASASKQCPVLLETSEGKKVLPSPEALLKFVQDCKDREGEEKVDTENNLMICVDTCHVFAAGYEPSEFLEKVLHRTRLVHFNDSVHEKGSTIDRHASIGSGCIGVERMMACAEIARVNGISLVVE